MAPRAKLPRGEFTGHQAQHSLEVTTPRVVASVKLSYVPSEIRPTPGLLAAATAMSFPTRTLPHIRQASTAGNPKAPLTGQSAALQARVNEKKAELEHLRQLRDLSAAMATQMEALEQKLSTLADGTEAIATVMGNWHTVLRAINMASAKVPKPQDEVDDKPPVDLPQTLVRIPTEHAPALQAQAEAAQEEGDSVGG